MTSSSTTHQPSLLFWAEIQDTPTMADCDATGRWLTVATNNGNIILYDLGEDREVTRWNAHKSGMPVIHWHPLEAILASGGQDGCTRIWSIANDGAVTKFDEFRVGQNAVEQLAWHKQGAPLALASGKEIRLVLGQDDLAARYFFPHSAITNLDWRPQSFHLTASGSSGILIYNILDPTLKPRHFYWKGAALCMQWSPDGQILATGCQDNTVHFWRLRDNSDAILVGYERKPRQLTWSSNSRWLVASGSRDILIWTFDGNGPENREPTTLPFHQKPLSAVAFAPKGQWLAAGCQEGIISIWQKLTDDSPTYILRGKNAIDHLLWTTGLNSLKLIAITRAGLVGVWEIVPKQSAE